MTIDRVIRWGDKPPRTCDHCGAVGEFDWKRGITTPRQNGSETDAWYSCGRCGEETYIRYGHTIVWEDER